MRDVSTGTDGRSDRSDSLPPEQSSLVLAGPGTGKTKIIIDKLVELTDSGKLNRSRVAALTFTSKAAGELRERVGMALADSGERVFIGTFHSFGNHILKAHGTSIGVPTDFILYDEEDKRELIQRLQSSGKLSGTVSDSTIARMVERAKSALSTEIVAPGNGSVLRPEVERVFGVYQQALAESGALDFGDLIYQVNRLFSLRPEILDLYRTAYRYILIDEFQDTTPGQYRMLQSLYSPTVSRLFAVADEDQLIFEWNEARLETINNFIRDFSAEVIFATLSFRCPPKVVSAANAVIQHNRFRFPNKPGIVSHPGHTSMGTITLLTACDATAEARQVATLVANLLASGSLAEDCAIIARASWILDSIEGELSRLGITSARPSLGGLGDTEESQILVRLLRWILNPRDAQSARRVILYLSPATYERALAVQAFPENEDAYYEQVLAELSRESGSADGLAEFVESLTRWRLGTTNTQWLLDHLAPELGSVLPPLLKDQKSVLRIRSAAVQLRDYSRTSYVHGRTPLSDFLLNLPRSVSTTTAPGGVVSLLTYHQAKGLGFREVFLPGLEQGILPDYRAEGHPHALEEERRLFYVGLTRSKSNVHISYSRSRTSISGKLRDSELSQFVREIPGDLIDELGESSAQ